MKITQDSILFFDPFKLLESLLDSLLESDFSGTGSAAREYLFGIFSGYLIFAIIFSAILIVLIVIISFKISNLQKKDEMKPELLSGQDKPPVREKTNKWDKVLRLIDSDNPGDWRLAILEADIILDELVSRMGYEGETLGEKMKNIEKSDFQTINDAWEAHKMRNIIAHRGSDYILTKREAKRIIELYARVFEEFFYI